MNNMYNWLKKWKLLLGETSNVIRILDSDKRAAVFLYTPTPKCALSHNLNCTNMSNVIVIYYPVIAYVVRRTSTDWTLLVSVGPIVARILKFPPTKVDF